MSVVRQLVQNVSDFIVGKQRGLTRQAAPPRQAARQRQERRPKLQDKTGLGNLDVVMPNPLAGLALGLALNPIGLKTQEPRPLDRNRRRRGPARRRGAKVRTIGFHGRVAIEAPPLADKDLTTRQVANATLGKPEQGRELVSGDLGHRLSI